MKPEKRAEPWKDDVAETEEGETGCGGEIPRESNFDRRLEICRWEDESEAGFLRTHCESLTDFDHHVGAEDSLRPEHPPVRRFPVSQYSFQDFDVLSTVSWPGKNGALTKYRRRRAERAAPSP